MDSSLPASQLRALITLLDDRDEALAARCRRRVLREGARAMPFLLESLLHPREGVRAAAAEVARTLRRIDAEQHLLRYVRKVSDGLDLEEAACLLAQTENPDLDVAALRAQLDRLAKELSLRAPGDADALEPRGIAARLKQLLAEEQGLKGNVEDYYDPQNSFIDQVLERKVGIPISLSAVYLFVCRRLDLPVYGVGLPGHFLLQCGTRGELFLDPFNGARTLDRAECTRYLAKAGRGNEESLLGVTPDRFILARMIANLLAVFRRKGDVERAERYRKMFEVVRGGG